MKIGGHLSVAGGYHHALTKTKEIGGNALQIFSSSPRSWQSVTPTPEAIQTFVSMKNELSIDPIYFHASYLVNLANGEWGGDQSVTKICNELNLASQMGIKGTIIHLGSFKSKENPTQDQYKILFSHIENILKNSPSDTYFIAENAGSHKIGASIEELGLIVKTMRDDRIKICIDTCHAHAAGYDLSTSESFDSFWTLFDKEIGLKNLEVFQINDSRDPLGSFRDRHENLGQGNIPQSVFEQLVNDKRTRNLPFILEVPGFEKLGPDKQNIDILKSFVQS
ncbi:MAG: hypothetical protein QG600_473 [Patescibacteria group bacterium]|jgi:deoxyribonuclease-4|nr:hypothetical protein [Patescibacteria group bacterium]